jgi:glycosyltransferase involved in cell wall biosynthesis
MRLAFIDLVFSWPPLGGAPLDLYHTVYGLQAIGHEVRLFFAADKDIWNRGEIAPGSLPFPTERLDFTEQTFHPDYLPQRFRAAVDAWKPDVVFVCFGFFLKPYLIEALAPYPRVSRYYAYEPPCPRDFRLFNGEVTCPKNFLKTPNTCRRCTMRALGREIRSGRPSAYPREFLAARGYGPDYYRLLMRSLASLDAVIVYNRFAKSHLDAFNSNIHVVPGGVNVNEFTFSPVPERGPNDRRIILMTGRVSDSSKGLGVLVKAGRQLAQKRNDFQIWATTTDPSLDQEWFKSVGWHDSTRMASFYQQSDICVVPSVWEEPFGLVAVEAMATGRPVCASRVGGLQEIVLHEETGFLYDRKDSEALAGYLDLLLDRPDLRARMGALGRWRAEREYDWEKVIAKHYPPLLEGLRR